PAASLSVVGSLTAGQKQSRDLAVTPFPSIPSFVLFSNSRERRDDHRRSELQFSRAISPKRRRVAALQNGAALKDAGRYGTKPLTISPQPQPQMNQASLFVVAGLREWSTESLLLRLPEERSSGFSGQTPSSWL